MIQLGGENHSGTETLFVTLGFHCWYNSHTRTGLYNELVR